jgi:DNA-binding beta-propeller fold protein YncE
VIDGAVCNGTQHAGCSQIPTTVVAGAGAFAVAINEATDTVYVANRDDGTISLIDGAGCNSSNTSGCGQVWPTVNVGGAPQALGVDELTDTVYVTNTGGNTVSVINGPPATARTRRGAPRSRPP